MAARKRADESKARESDRTSDVRKWLNPVSLQESEWRVIVLLA